jgi:F-type H+-transporting ATPase subunit b
MPQITQLPFIFASQFFWLAVFFGLIFFVIARGMVPKIKSTVAARDEKIAEDLQKAQAARVAADETEAAWRARMDAARVDAARIAHEAKQESARETEARVKAALGEIDARVDQARVRIWTSVQAARAEVEAVAADAANAKRRWRRSLLSPGGCQASRDAAQEGPPRRHRRGARGQAAVDNPDLLQRVRDVGVTLETAAALFVAPLVQVAWADGSVASRNMTRPAARARARH